MDHALRITDHRNNLFSNSCIQFSCKSLIENEGHLRYSVQNVKCEEEFLAETSRNNVIKIHPSCSIQNIH